jgi:tetratricopeptide (TPR) repeat protein
MTTPPLMPQLRSLLDRSEPYALVYAQHPNGAAIYIEHLDEMTRLADACSVAGLAIDAEQVRVVALDGRARRDAEGIIAALGGVAAPNESGYRRILRELATQRRSARQRRRTIAALASILLVLAVVYIVVTAPPSANTPAITTAALAGETTRAYTLAQQEYASFPQDPEVLLWLSVLAEATGDVPAAARYWQRTLALSPAPGGLVYERGNTRLLAGNLAAARVSVGELLAVPQTVPEGLFLEAAVLEAEGDVKGAIAGFEQASRAADSANRQEMVALIRIRMGGLMRFGVDATPTP